MIVAGPTCSGKTRFVINCLKQQMFEVAKSELNSDLSRPYPDRLVWAYGEIQPAFIEVRQLCPQVEFIKDVWELLDDTSEKRLDPIQQNLVILDELMGKLKGDVQMAEMFVRGCHHGNTTFVYIVQNICEKGSETRTATLNEHYLVCFKNPRENMQIALLGSQMYPGRDKAFGEIFENATRKPYCYLLIDLKQETPNELPLRTNIFPGEKHRSYILE